MRRTGDCIQDAAGERRVALHFEIEVAGHAGGEGGLVGGMVGDPLFVGHVAAPVKKRLGVGADRMTELRGALGGDFKNFVGDDGGWDGIGQGGSEEGGETRGVRVERMIGVGFDTAGHGGVDDAGFDESDADVERLQFNGEAFGEGFEGPLGSAVGGERRIGDAPSDGGDVNDAAGTALAHVGDDGLDAAEGAEVVGFHGGTEISEWHFLDGADALDAGIVDEDVDGAVEYLNGRDGGGDGLIVVDIESGDGDGKIFAGGGLREFGRGGGIAHGGVDVVASTGESECGFEADTFAGAGDEYGGHEDLLWSGASDYSWNWGRVKAGRDVEEDPEWRPLPTSGQAEGAALRRCFRGRFGVKETRMRCERQLLRAGAMLLALCWVPGAVVAQLRVTVRESSGNLLNDEATIRLSPLATGPNGVGMTAKEVRTNAGEALIDIWPGEYLVEAEAPGYQRAMANATVLAGSSTELRLYLAPLKKAGGEAVAPSGVVMAPALKKEMDKASSALNEKNLGEARKHLKKALEISPSNPDALYLLGVVDYTEKDKAAAEKEFEEVLKRYPEHGGSLLMLGQIKLESGEKQEAVTLLEKAVEASPTKWLAHELLAFAYARSGQLDKAYEEAKRTGELNKERVPAMRLLEAKILLKKQKNAEAGELLESIVKEFPESGAAKEAREMLGKMKAPGTPAQ